MELGAVPLVLKLVNHLGNPDVPCIVSQNGESLAACVMNVTITIDAKYYTRPCDVYPPACTISSTAAGEGAGLGVIVNTAGRDFRRGDSNADGDVDIADPVFTLFFLFSNGTRPPCLDAADSNDDEQLHVSDPIHTLSWLFIDGDIPEAPGPLVCGPDPTDEIVLVLDCRTYNQCNQTDSDGDGLTNFFETQVLGTNPDPMTGGCDSDGDGFADGQEYLPTGVPGCNGGALNIAEDPFNADPRIPDLFVEIDYMEVPAGQPNAHTHRPSDLALQTVVQAFQNRGIALHVDTGTAPFDLGGGNALAHLTYMDFTTGDVNDFHDFKASSFDGNNRCNVFHYNIWCHRQNASDGCSSGLGEICGDDFIVSLGCLLPQQTNWVIEGGTFMHELGHNLCLKHGGDEGRNCKPNYRSVMNYLYQLVGIDIDCDAVGDGVLDYSDEVLATLDEMCLDEPVGICPGALPLVPIDWNVDSDFDDLCLQRHVNTGAPGCEDDGLTPLTGHDDWANLEFFMNNCQGGGAGQGEPEIAICRTLNDL